MDLKRIYDYMTGRPETYKGLKDVGYDDFEKSMGDARYRRGVYNQLYINGGINSKYDVFEGSWQKTYGEPAAGAGETGVVNGDVEPVLDINSTRILGAEDFERYEAEQKPSSTMDTYDYEKMRVDPEKERQRLDAFRGELEEEGVNSESVYAAIDAGEKEIEKGWQEALQRRDDERREDSRVPVGQNFARVEGMYEDTPAARDLSNFSLAKDLYDDARNLLDASFKGSGFGRGVWDAVYDVDAWTAGLTELGKNVQLNRVYEKAKKGEELTASEARLLDAANYYTLAGALQQAYLPSEWYRWGQGLGGSIPYMLEFALTYGPASSVTKGLARAVFKKLGGGTVGRVGGEVIHGVTTGAVQTPLNATNVVSGTYDRMMGEAEVATDENGVPVFMGMTDQKGFWQALGEATGAQYIENLSEVSGRMLSGAGHLIKRTAPRFVQKGLEKIVDNRYVRAMADNAFTRGARKVGKRFKIGNAPEEIYEEYFGGTINGLLIGDTDLESLYSMQSFVDITGTVAVTQVFLGAVGASMNHGSKRSLVKRYEKAEREYDALFSSPEERDMYVSYVNLNLNGVQGEGGKPMLTVLREAVEKMVNSHGDNFVRADGTFDTEAAKAYREEVSRVFGNYFVAKQLYDSYMAGIRTRKEADRERIATEMQEKAVNGQIMTVTLADGRRARVVSGDIVVDGDGRIDVGRSGDHFTAVYEDDGSTVQLPVEDSYTVEVVSVEDAVEAASRANDELINREEEEAVYGPRPKLGETVTMLDSEGNRVQLVVSGEVDESGNFMAMPMEDFDNNVNGMAVAVNMSQIVRDDAASEGVDGANEYQSFVNEGTVSDATVERIAGKIANGESLTAEEEAMRQGANERVEGALAKLRDMEGEKQGESALSRIEKDAKGQPLYEKADVETAWDALVEQSEGDESIARDVAASMVKDKEAALKKMEKAPAKGATPAEKIADAKVRKENIDKARAELEHWQAIAGVSQSRADGQTDGNAVQSETPQVAGDVAENPVGRSLNAEEADMLISQMEQSAEVAPEMELTPENWIREFGKGGIVRTPIGDVKQGENQYLKLAQQGRNSKLGMVRPTLERPNIIIEDERPAKEGESERNTSYVFVKTFTKSDGSRYYYFASVTVSKDGKEVVISSQERSGNRISKLLQQGKVAWIDIEFSLHPTTQVEGSVPLNDSNTLTYTDNQPALLGINSSELSTSESIERIGEKQGKSEENAVISSEEDIDVTVGRVMEIPDAGDRSALVSGLLASAKAEEKSVSRVKNKVDPRNTQAFLAEQQRIRGEQDKARAEVAYWEEVKRIVEESNAAESAPAETSKVKAARPKSIRERISALGEVLNLRDYILRALATGEYKFIWGDNRNGTKGLGSHLGFGNNRRGIEERQRRIWLLNNEEGLYPEQVAERLYANIQAEYPYLAQDDVEVFNEMLDVLRYDSAKDMVSEAEDMRRRREEMYEEYDSDQAMYDATMQERDERVDAENEAYRRELESQESGTPAEGRAAEPLGDTVAAAEAEVNTNPTEKQKEAGNYRKGHVRIDGFNVTIENPKGSIRSGVDATGKEWSITMNNTYGYMRGTQGVDGDHIDVFLSDNPDNGNVYIVDQINQETGEFDEHKVMYGFNSMEEAKEAYLSNYSEGWKIGNVTEVSKEEFKKWVNSSHRKTKPFAEYSSINTISGESGDAVTDNLTPNTETTAIQGFDGYSQSEIKSIVQEYIQQKLDENDISANVVGIAVHGSRVRGNAKENSDLDVVVEYEGDIREDGMFNLLNDDDNGEALYIEGIRVDINPIRAQETGTLDKYMERSRKYDEEVLSNDSVEDSHGEGDVRYRKDEEKSGVGTDIQGNPVDENGTLFRYFTGSLSELISQARKSATNLIKKVIAPVSSRLRKDLNNQGLQIDDDYNHVIDNNAIRHTLKKHSGKNEEKRGQIPITETDFEYIADVVENYDAVEVVPSKTSAQRIIYRKAYSDGSVVYVEEQRVGRKELAAVTMWKKKSPNLTDANRFETTQISDLTEALVDKDSETSVTGQETAEKVDGEDTRYRRGEDGVQGVRRTQESEMEREVRGFGERMADRLGGGVRLVYSDEIADSEAHAEEKRRSKGYYDTATGEVVVVLDNNTVKGVPSVIEVAMTMMHEVVGHKGVRGLFGTKEDAFLDDVYRGMKARTKAEMESLYGGQLRRRAGESEEAFEARRRRLLADEYIARVAEEGNNPGLLRRVGAKVRGLLRGLGVELAITDNEIRDILRRSARELTRRKDVAMNVREDGGVRYRQSVNERFNEELKRYEKGNDVQRRSIVEEATEYLDIRFRLTEEEQGIVEEAKRDGSYMKAPNGAPTRLTEKQWAGVRTKAFKAWFGDWEKAARIEKLRKSEPVEISGEEITPSDDLKQYKKNALEYGKRLQGEYTNKDTGRVIQLQRGRKNGGLKEVLQHDINDAAHIQSVAAIPQIIENAVYIDSAENRDVNKNPQVAKYHYYVCGLKIGGEDYTVRMVEAEEKDGSRYYDHKLTHIEKGKLIDELALLNLSSSTELSSTPGTGTGERNRPTNRGETQTVPVSDVKDKQLLSLLQTNSSKVVDENGEPMVVYHGTLAKGLHRFSEDFVGSRFSYDEKGFFFISNERIANDYAISEFDSSRKGEVIPAFVSLKSPLVVDAVWCRENGLGSRVFKDNDVIEFWDNYQSLMIEESENNDGIVITDGKDTMVVAFRPNQIKSATENTGAFSAESDDIRYRAAEADYASVQEDASGEYAEALSAPMDISVADMMPIEAAENAQAAGLLRDVVNRFPDTKIAITDLSRVYAAAEVAEEEATEVRYRRGVNERFNEELERQIAGELPKGHVYSLGRPSEVLLAAGIPDLPIELAASRLGLKASAEYESNHPFELREVMNLPEAIQHPIAVFDSKTRVGSKVILVELKDRNGNNFVVAMNTNVPKSRYSKASIQINDIRSIYPKDNVRDIVGWISRGDLLRYADKKKIEDWITQQRSNSAEVEIQNLDVAANIVKEFENPTIDGENVRYRRGISFDTRGASHRDTDITGRRERSFGEKASRLAGKAGISLYDEQLKLKQLQGKVAEWLTGSRKGALDDRLLFYEAENQAGSIAMDRKVRFDNEYRERLFALRAEVFKALGNKVDDKYYFYAKTLNERVGVIGEKAMAANKATMFSHLLSEQHPGHDFPEGFFDPKEYGYEALQAYARKEEWIDSIEGYIADCESRMGEKLVSDIWGVIGEIAEYQLTTSMKKGLITRDHFDRLMYGRPLAELVRENLEKGLITEGQYRAFLATDFTADELVKAGFITREQREGLKRRYEYYLPLKGDSEPTTEEVADYERSRSRVSWQIKSVKGGNTRLVNDPVSRLLADVYASISYQEKMAWIQSMYHALRLAERQGKGAGDFAILDNWVVKDETGDYVPYVRYVEGEPVFTPTEQEIAKGEVERARNLPIETAIRVPEAVQGEHIVKLKHRGRTIHIYFRDPAVANAVNNHFVPRNVPKLMKGLRAAGGFMGKVYTQWNIFFSVRNLSKDFGEAAINNYVQYGGRYMAEYMVNYWRVMRHAGTTLRGAKRSLVPTNDYERRVEEFFKYGGEVSYTQIESYDKAIRDFERELKRSADKRGVVSVTEAGFVKIGKAVSAANKLIELNARLATFITSRERGYGLRQSIRDAKEVTVNFDRRGRNSMEFGSLFLFWNAGRQSNRRKWELMRENPGRFWTSRAAMGLLNVAQTYVLGSALAAVFGIDWEDYMTGYYDIPDYIRYNNIVVMSADGKVYRIPLSPAFAPYKTLVENIGEATYRTAFNDRDGRYDWGKGMADIVKSVSADLGDLTTWEAEGGKRLIGWAPAPTVPLLEAMCNVDFTGRPVYKVGNSATPGYKRAYAGTKDVYVEITEWLNRVSGGEEAYGSWVGRRANPGAVQHVVEGYLGGLIQVLSKFWNVPEALKGASYERLPFVDTFYYGDAEMLGEREVRDDIYDARRLVESYNDVRSNFRKTDEDYENNPKTSQYLENNEYRIDELKDLLKMYDEVTEELKSEDSEAYRRELRLLRRSIVELTNEMEEY